MSASASPQHSATELIGEVRRRGCQKRRALRLVGSCTAVLVLATCGGANGDKFAPVNITTVRIVPASGTVIVGQTLTLSAVPVDAAGNQLAGRTISWTSSATSIATVSQGGTVQGVSPGLATISATSEGRVGFADVTVTKVPVVTVSVQPGALTMEAGQTIPLTVVPKDPNGNPLVDRQATFISDNQAVATVDAVGVVTGKTYGNASILVTVDGKTATALVSVRPPVPVVASVSVAPAQLALGVGETATLQTTVLDAGGIRISDRSPLWATSNASVATVSVSGTVTAISAGSARVTATVEGKAGSTDITVSQAAQTVASISLAPTNLALVINGFGQLTATPLDAQGRALSSVPITWTSSAPSIVSASSTGLLTGLAIGSAVITASASGKSANAAVTVSSSTGGSGVLSRIDVAPSYGAYVVGDTGTFAFLPLGGDGKTVVIPSGSFSVSGDNGNGFGYYAGRTECFATGCLQHIENFTLANGQPPKSGYMKVFATTGPSGGPPSGKFLVTIISNVLDSLVLQGPGRSVAGQAGGSSEVSVNSAVQVYPYVFSNNGWYTQATNAEYTVTAGTADIRRCTQTLGGLTVQVYCGVITPRVAGTVTVQARLRKSDGNYWTSSLTFTAK